MSSAKRFYYDIIANIYGTYSLAYLGGEASAQGALRESSLLLAYCGLAYWTTYCGSAVRYGAIHPCR